ncbi:hypothetical protein [Paenibacillus sp. GCM10027626]|uniref:hypothetical protein n=1 Tax=Paenibacillus sp. GCM10027626 TaxID=3273411 RepID=UPI00363D9EA1
MRIVYKYSWTVLLLTGLFLVCLPLPVFAGDKMISEIESPWQAGVNVTSVQTVSASLNAPGKPFEGEAMLEAVRQFCGRQQLADDLL